jgi:hypothetical protein
MDESAVFPIYIIVKYAAYVAWCYFGPKWLRNRVSIGSAVGFGSARLGLAMVFGVAIFLARFCTRTLRLAPGWSIWGFTHPCDTWNGAFLAALLLEGFRTERRFGEGLTQRWILGGIVCRISRTCH